MGEFTDHKLFPNIGSTDTDGLPIRVRFYNICRDNVDVFWLNWEKKPTKYGRLSHMQYLDVKTFKNHPWVARRSSDGCEVLMNKQSVFWPQPALPNVIVRASCVMTMKVQSLKELTARSFLSLTVPEIGGRIKHLPRELGAEILHLLAIKHEYQQVICRAVTVPHQREPPM